MKIYFLFVLLLTVSETQSASRSFGEKSKKSKETKNDVSETPLYVRDTVPPYIAGHKDYVAFRIPTLLVDEEWIYTFAQGRKTSYEDFKGPQHIVFRRSKTRGKKWKPMQVLAEANEGYKCGPMSPVLLGKNRILLMWVEQADDENKESEVFTIKSEDAGNTWSARNKITHQVKREYDRPGKWFGVGPSSGLVKQHEPNVGRIYIVASQSGVEINRESQKFAPSHLIFSDNEGESWNVGKPMQIKSKEATVVELANGHLMVNARNNDLPHRVVGISSNGGQSFDVYDGSEDENPGKKLNDCGESVERKDEYKCGVHSGLLVHPDEGSSKRSFLIFSNPQGEDERTIGTLQLSKNSGEKWKSKTIRYTDDIKDNQKGYSGYSNLAFLKEGNHTGGSIAIIFERGGTSPEDYKKGRALIENESWQINFNTFEGHEEKSLLERVDTAQPRHHMIDFKIIPYAAFSNQELRQSIEEPENKLKTCVNMDSSMGKVQHGECKFN